MPWPRHAYKSSLALFYIAYITDWKWGWEPQAIRRVLLFFTKRQYMLVRSTCGYDLQTPLWECHENDFFWFGFCTWWHNRRWYRGNRPSLNDCMLQHAPVFLYWFDGYGLNKTEKCLIMSLNQTIVKVSVNNPLLRAKSPCRQAYLDRQHKTGLSKITHSPSFQLFKPLGVL